RGDVSGEREKHLSVEEAGTVAAVTLRTDNADLRHHKNQLVTITGGVVSCYDYRNPFLYDRVAGMVISAPPLQIDNVVCDVELTPYV
ncbi:TPA: hypothetical protein KE186_004518, partial [Escherichia coli]|nr:hypothetical protein [Escherichia coli]